MAPTTAEEDPSAASDAVSLHTIAEQADAYETQEQEDADLALALALEEEESARFARTQSILHPQGSEPSEPLAAPETEAFLPYRDDPDAVDDIDPPPYRDDPNAGPAEGEQTADAEAAGVRTQRQNIFLRIVRKIAKVWLCYLIWSTVITIIIIIVVVILAFVYGGKGPRGDPKEAAWLASGSNDYELNLPKLYPALAESSSSTCKDTWEELASSLPCHRMILSPAWDDGNATEVKMAGADPVYYNDAVCTRTCKTALMKIDSPVLDKCVNRSDRFDFERYGKDGRAYFEKQDVVEGPAEVAQTLLARYDRLCSGPPKKYFGKKPLSCAEELWLTWGIVDGKNEANLNGLDTFLSQTSVRKTIPATKQTVVKLMPSGRNETFKRSVSSRRVGPHRGQTECSNCLKDWLTRKTLSYRPGQILHTDPKKGELGLAEFAKKMQNASQRCYSYNNREERVWKAMGWWCDGAPCRDDYGRDILPAEVLTILHGTSKKYTTPGPYPPNLYYPPWPAPPNLDIVPSNKKKAVRAMLDAAQDSRCPGALGLFGLYTENPYLVSAHILSHLCTPRCLNEVDRMSVLAKAAEYPESTFVGIPGSLSTTRMLCDLPFEVSSPNSFKTTPDTLCTPGQLALKFDVLRDFPPLPGSVPDPDYEPQDPYSRADVLATFRTGLAAVKAWNDEYGSDISRSQESLRKLRIAESACNTCVGQHFIGQEGKWKETVDAFLADPDVNGTEYVRVAREGWVQCGKMFGVDLRWRERKELFEKVGLGDGVGGLPN